MSLPNEILDPLLSGYLDDMLSEEERAQVEQLLQRDERVRGELESMRQMRSILRAIDRSDLPLASRRLGVGFADRVVDAAIERARHQGLADDHPLIRSSESPAARRSSPVWNRPVIATLAALAASGLIAVGTLIPGRDEPVANLEPSGAAIAAVDDAEGTGSRASNDLRIAESPVVDVADGGAAPEAAGDPLRIARSEAESPETRPPGNRGAPAESLAQNPAPSTGEMAVDAVPSVDSLAGSEATAAAAEAAMSVADATPNTDRNTAEEPPATLPLAVLVLDIRRTEQGRFGGAVQAAMREARITSISQRPISAGIVSSVSDAVGSSAAGSGADEVSGSVMYIEAPAKRIDQFILKLLADREGIEAVGMSLATDAPLMGLAQSVEPVDATTVRQGRAWELGGDAPAASAALARHLGDRSFLPMSEAMVGGGALLAVGEDDGPDILSRVFLLIR